MRVLRLARPKALRLLATTRTYRIRVAVNLFAFLGAAATVEQIAEWMFDERFVRNGWVVGALIVGLLVVLVQSLPAEALEFVHPHYPARITVEVGDLLAACTDTAAEPKASTKTEPVVITANRHLDSGPGLVSPESLIGQLGRRWFPGGEGTELATMITSATGALPETEHPLGTVVTLRHQDATVLVLAVSARHPDQSSAVLIDDIWTALSALWGHARRGNLTSIAMPVVGSGFARAQVGLTPLLMLLITSYATATMERPVCALRIVLPADGFDPRVFELVHSYCEALGFTRR